MTVDIDYVHPAASGSNFDGRDDNDLDAAVSYTAGSTRKPGHHYHGASSKQSQIQYIPVPEDSSRVNNICPICQERFEDKWLDEAQEWVWMDAVKIGERVFHPSCYREAARDHRDATPSYGARGTPEPVLGKRKAEVCFFMLLRIFWLICFEPPLLAVLSQCCYPLYLLEDEREKKLMIFCYPHTGRFPICEREGQSGRRRSRRRRVWLLIFRMSFTLALTLMNNPSISSWWADWVWVGWGSAPCEKKRGKTKKKEHIATRHGLIDKRAPVAVMALWWSMEVGCIGNRRKKQRARQGKARQINSFMVYHYYYSHGYWATVLLATYLPACPMIMRLVGWHGMGWQ